MGDGFHEAIESLKDCVGRTRYSDLHRHDTSLPFTDGMRFTAIKTLGDGELSRTSGADAAGLKSIELLSTFAALPEFADRWRGLACRTSKPDVARQLCES